MDRSKLGKKNRIAGHNLEREVVNSLKEIFGEDFIIGSSRYYSKATDDKKIDIYTEHPFLKQYQIQCNKELITAKSIKPNLEKFFDPYFKGNNKILWKKLTKRAKTREASLAEIIVMDKETFLNLLKSAYEKTGN